VDPAGQDWRRNFRPDIPSGARVYDFLLGGKDNYPADRELARTLMARLPTVQLAVQWNRSFLRRVVRYLVGEAGIDQVIDIGAGLPSVGNTHEVALDVNPGARVVYVDHDPVVLAHARDMLQGIPNTAIIARDLLEPEAILTDPDLMGLIDFSRPVAFMFLSMLHFVPDDADPAGLIARLHAPFPAGTRVAISHAAPDVITSAQDEFVKATEQVHARTRDEVAALIAGLDLVPPGLVWLPEWRPEPGDPEPENPAEAYYYAMVARKP
jgi:O-methyltransferase involved in polyketide biosynthesis